MRKTFEKMNESQKTGFFGQFVVENVSPRLNEVDSNTLFEYNLAIITKISQILSNKNTGKIQTRILTPQILSLA